MPYWERQAHLSRSLAAYRRLYGDVEISICDDGSRAAVDARGCVVTRLPAKSVGMNPCVPMNVAVRSSTHPVIVLTNPEIEHREPILWAMLEMLEGPLDYVAATCIDSDGSKLSGDDVHYERKLPRGAHFHFCAMLHRELFELAGGFDERYREGRGFEDADFLWRLNQVGARFRLADVTVYHHRTPHPFAGSTSKNARIYDTTWPERL